MNIMVARGRGGTKTPERVMELLKTEVIKTSQSAASRNIGLTQSAVGRYIQGIGEPSTATLEKLAAYFGVSVAWLRGEPTIAINQSLTFLNTKRANDLIYSYNLLGNLGFHDLTTESLKFKIVDMLIEEQKNAIYTLEQHGLDLTVDICDEFIKLIAELDEITGFSKSEATHDNNYSD